MSASARAPQLSRRQFLKQVGAAMVLAAARPVASGSHVFALPALLAAEPTPFSIGVLVPQSRIAPTFGPQLLDGLRLSLAQGGNRVAGRTMQLVAVPADRRPGAMLQQARTLVGEQHVDLLVGGVSWHAVAPLGSLLAETQTPMIVADLGANVGRLDRARPFILRNSLNHWQAQAVLGQWAATAFGRRAMVVSSFYDSGYDTLFAFQRGFELAGGAVAQPYVSHLPAGGGLGDIFAAIRAARPDLVFAAYSGRPAAEFARAYAADSYARHVPLLGSSMLASDALLAEQGNTVQGMASVFSWANAINTPSHHAFVHDFAAANGRPADAFAALGFDTGRLILAATQGLHLADSRSTMLRDALQTAQYTGARGTIRMRSDTLDAVGPLYLRYVRPSETHHVHAAFGQLGTAGAFDHAWLGLADEPKTGWANTYLCV